MDSDYSPPESLYETADDIDEEYVPDGQDDAAESSAIADAKTVGDFDRFIIQTQHADVKDNAGWEFNIGEDEDFDIEEEMRISSGIGRRRTRRSRGEPELSQEVKSLLGEANGKYMEADYGSAIKLFREVIKIEPAARGVWATLALCHKELGDEKQALQLEIIDAHLGEQDIDIWRDLGRRSKDLGYIQQAIYCFRKILMIDPYDMDALWDRSYLLKVSGDLRRAHEGFLKILKYQPSDADVLEQLRLIYLEMNEPIRARILFQEAFDYCKANNPGATESSGNAEFGLLQIIALADFYNNAGEYRTAVSVVREGARWLDGRLSECGMWDDFADDREFDVEGGIRDNYMPSQIHTLDVNLRHRLAVSRLRLGELAEAEIHASIVLSSDIRGYCVLFIDLADTYFDLGMYDEALHIYVELGAHEETSSIPVLLRIGACHRNLANYDEAIEVFTWAMQVAPNQNEVKTKLAEVYEITGQLQKALDLVDQVIESRDEGNKAATSIDTSAGVTSPADISLDPVVGSFFDENSRKTVSKGAKQRRALGMTREQLVEYEKNREQATITTFARLETSEESMLRGERQAVLMWLADAGTLVEEFRVTRQLFTSDRYATFRGVVAQRRQRHGPLDKRGDSEERDSETNMARRLHRKLADSAVEATGKLDEGVTDFRGVSFDRWMMLMIQYSLLLTKEGQATLAEEVLRHAAWSNALSAPHYQNALRMALLTCAAYTRNPHVIVEQCRHLAKENQYNNEVIRLTLACLDGGVPSTNCYISSNYQKFSKRQLKYTTNGDAALRQRGRRRRNAAANRRPSVEGMKSGEDSEDSDDSDSSETIEDVGKGRIPNTSADEHNKSRSDTTPADRIAPPGNRVTKVNPVALVHYAQISMCAKSFQSALYFLLQAYEVQPHDPLICLNLAISSVGRAMQRQADNRHALVLQAVAFLDKYREYRASEEFADEIEFNFGRAFHQLNLLSLAAKHYEEVLKIITKRLEQSPSNQDHGCAREAAYNLSLIFITNGAVGLAHSLYKKWLSV